MREKYLKSFACLNSNAILGVIESLEQLRVDLVEAFSVHIFAHERHDFAD